MSEPKYYDENGQPTSWHDGAENGYGDAEAKLAARLAEAERERDDAKVLVMKLDRGLVQCIAEKMTAEARVRELEHALRRASERLSWLRDHHCSSEFARGQAKMAADECWRVQAGERATASARAVQEGGNG